MGKEENKYNRSNKALSFILLSAIVLFVSCAQQATSESRIVSPTSTPITAINANAEIKTTSSANTQPSPENQIIYSEEDAPTPKRIEFAHGRNTATVKDGVVRTEFKRYVLAARAGQQMTVRITSFEDNAAFNIFTAGDEELISGSDAVKQWSQKLPKTGNYIIEVGATRGNAGYTLKVTIR